MFNVDRLIEDCRAALREGNPQSVVKEVLERAVSVPEAVVAALGAPRLAGVQTLFCDAELTVLNIAWAPRMTLHPHDHRMWACIGIYGGREDNVFYRRNGVSLVRHGHQQLEARNTVALGDSVIHAVANPLDQFTAAIHVYGGDFFATPRSEWDPVTLAEAPYDIEHTRRVFREANERLQPPI